jgi:NADPH:quinone reductase-like Zn-dependent oxidoreductase
MQKGLAPLLVARGVDRPGPLSDYGLDAPLATLTYQLAPAAPVIVTVGGANFDRSLFYVQRGGDAKVYLVLAGAIRPVLALVGIQVAPAAG